MSIFLRAEMFGIQGLALPFDKGELLDSEYADDTALFERECV